MTVEAIRAALGYHAAGLSVIPARREDKRPLLPWREFQTRRPIRAEIMSWFTLWPDAGIALVCGTVSGLAVADFDPRNGDGLTALKGRLPVTPTVETGGGGRHYYFRLAPGERLGKIPNLLPGMDLQAEASCVVAPPSLHPSQRRYRWLPGLALGEVSLAPLPPVIRQLIALYRAPEVERPTSRHPLREDALTVEGVLSRLGGVRRCGRGWVARCPAHEDREPSLSIGQSAEGRVLLYCHAGCSFAEILTALCREAA